MYIYTYIYLFIHLFIYLFIHLFIYLFIYLSIYIMAPKTMKKKGFGHLKTRLFTIKTSKNIGFGGPMVNVYIYMYT